MTARFTLKQRLRYRFDNGLARGIWVVLIWLGAVTTVLVRLVSTVTWLLRLGPGDEPTSFPEGVWLAMGCYLDAGTFTGDHRFDFQCHRTAARRIKAWPVGGHLRTCLGQSQYSRPCDSRP